MPFSSRNLTRQIIALLGTPVGALTIVMVAEGCALFVTTYFGTPQRYQVNVLASIPAIAGVIYVITDFVRDRLEQRVQVPNPDPESIVTYQLMKTWGPPFGDLQEFISITERRLEASENALTLQRESAKSNLIHLVVVGYKCVQTARSIQFLCSNGYPDQALSLCRALLEQEASLFFIQSVDDPEGVFQRYLDWEFAKIYLDVKNNRCALDKRGIGPTDQEWETLTKEYNRLEEKHRGNGNLKNQREWAIGTRKNGEETIKAFSVRKKAEESLPYLASDQTAIFEAWMADWQRLNEFTHMTPKSIDESASSNKRGLVATGRSSIGLAEPMKISGRAMLNISSVIARLVNKRLDRVESTAEDELSRNAMETFQNMLKKLENLPIETAPWHEQLRRTNDRCQGRRQNIPLWRRESVPPG